VGGISWIDQSWDRYVYKVPKEGKTKCARLYAETSRKIIFSWMYSWMTRGCETEAEYIVSKRLFVNYLESPGLLKKIGPDLLESVQTMYRKAVYPYEANFDLFWWKTLFAFEEYSTNTTQEASFPAVKRGTLAVLPSMDVDCSVRQQLNQQAAKKGVIYEAMALARLSHTAVWSTIAGTTSILTAFGAGLLETE
jgi:hypothetical protein